MEPDPIFSDFEPKGVFSSLVGSGFDGFREVKGNLIACSAGVRGFRDVVRLGFEVRGLSLRQRL